MEAATSQGVRLLTRDGASLAAANPPRRRTSVTQPIDGVATCGCCGRFPLVGERVTLHRSGERTAWACDNCERDGRAATIGEVTTTDRIRSLGGAMNVRRAS